MDLGTHGSVHSTPRQDRAPQSPPPTRGLTARCRPGTLGLWTQSWQGGLLCRVGWLGQLLIPLLLPVCLPPLPLALVAMGPHQSGRQTLGLLEVLGGPGLREWKRHPQCQERVNIPRRCLDNLLPEQHGAQAQLRLGPKKRWLSTWGGLETWRSDLWAAGRPWRPV